MRITIYSDGACSLGNGGWAYSNLSGSIQASGNERNSTNNRMELRAVIEALKCPLIPVEVPITIVSDSAYVVNCMTQQWWVKWIRKDWTVRGKPVKNRPLWEELLEANRKRLFAGLPGTEWIHVRGHGKGRFDDPLHVQGNDVVDKLAVAARLELVGAR